jgi:CubicO group peptidase (beta-lactamase class C family)
MQLERRLSRAFALAIAVAVVPIALVAQTGKTADVESKVDAVFAKYTASTPGCAVGVATNGKPALARAYGMSDLEHDVRISPETIFEAGSVSKQFTAAAVLLLARDGKLSLDDPVRKYIPELPDYGSPLTIRHMLSHTSGLRDWGSVAGIGGWPRTTRVHTQAHMLDIVSRQHALNFTPGTRWSYSNTGFNLAAMIVSRVSGTPFPEFTRTRLFTPLGMTHTSWRDDFTRIVKNRAVAYSEGHDGFHTDMPFENVYGNGGLLTTVGDLLKWNENFTSPVVGNASFVAEQQRVGTFNDGRPHGYGLGLFVGTHQGLREVSHSGSTAGYNAFLTRFPDQHVSVAVLCNAASAQATQYAHAVADVFLADRLKPSQPTATYTLTAADISSIAGQYRAGGSGVPITFAREKDGLRAGRLGMLLPQSSTRFLTTGGQVWERDAYGFRLTDEFGTVEEYAHAAPWKPTPEQLATLAGTYTSDEAETLMTAIVEDGGLVLKQRPDKTIALTPLYANAFSAGSLGIVIFRYAGGRPTELSVVQDRVWDLRFAKRQPGGSW